MRFLNYLIFPLRPPTLLRIIPLLHAFPPRPHRILNPHTSNADARRHSLALGLEYNYLRRSRLVIYEKAGFPPLTFIPPFPWGMV
ncbi:hypothetical protein AKJ39_02420 [candidate division MSBL1 archaeon SCGC-AAA259J03]|uniref:Uncharacterized protein n=1 Tax=candidate division MSBL1 archaeon SCGC-AAA259J03 TaxID=1698269 RepID=A0A656YWY7_9EURY|nr:hypothetical protein AKJ39_02420 [candidate division MSBL1 archaeon SCGC-AAA259J03]